MENRSYGLYSLYRLYRGSIEESDNDDQETIRGSIRQCKLLLT